MQIPPEIEIASYITNFGHDVTWILSSEEIEKVEETAFNSIHVFILPCRYSEGFTKIISKTSYAFRRMCFVFNTFKNGKYNLIFVGGDLFDAFLALCIRKKYGIPFVFQMVNPIEQIWETDKVYSQHKCFCYLLSKIRHRLTLYALRRADLVLPVGRFMKEYLAEKGLDDATMINIPQGVDLDRFSDANGDEIKKRYGIQHSNIIIYIGTMDKLRHLDVLIRTLFKIKERRTNVKLLMVGDGTDKPNLEELANEFGIKNDVIFTGLIHDYEVPNFIAAADIGISAVPPLYFYKVSCPIKMIEYMVMGKPVVANEEIPEQKIVIGASGGGVLVEFEAESFADGIIKLLDNPGQAEDMGRRGRDWVEKNRSYDVISRELENGFLEVLER